jgi:hypothetical protein
MQSNFCFDDALAALRREWGKLCGSCSEGLIQFDGGGLIQSTLTPRAVHSSTYDGLVAACITAVLPPMPWTLHSETAATQIQRGGTHPWLPPPSSGAQGEGTQRCRPPPGGLRQHTLQT